MSSQSSDVGDDAVSSSWNFERTFALKFYEAIGSPRSLRQALLLERGAYDDLNGLSTSYNDYQEPKHFAEEYQVAELLRKSRSIPGVTPSLREEKARAKFIGAEARNADTNTRLMDQVMPIWFGDFSYQLLRILGPLDDGHLEQIAVLGGFGPGVNVGVRGDGLVPSIKYDTLPVATKAVADLLPALMPGRVSDYWGVRLTECSQIVDGNHHFTVPKSWDIDRCAAKEPLWNSFLQAGIGKFISRRLERFGVDLHDQRLNQTLASVAQDWGLATVDLSSASDTMARVLVWLALCYNGDPNGKRWFHLLNTARSPKMRLPDQNGSKSWVALEMFASMGNGFTFPLETALFLALARCTVNSKDWCVVTAYGDDIILPQRDAHQFVERLEYLGFQVNSKKTCLAGAFFESCGTDWYLGTNVRPFYLHRDPENPAPYALQAANALRAWCYRIYGFIPAKLESLWRWCKGHIPTIWRNPVPVEFGDVGLHVDLLTARTMGVRVCEDPWTEAYWVTHVKLSPVTKDRKSFGVLTHALSQRRGTTDGQQTRGLEPVRGLYGRIRTEKSPVIWNDGLALKSNPSLDAVIDLASRRIARSLSGTQADRRLFIALRPR